MAKKTRRKKSAKGRIRRGKQVTPQRLMELSFAYAPPLIISAGVSNKVFDSLENGAKTSEQVAEETGASARALRILMKIFPYARERLLSSKQPTGHARRVFWNYCAADHLTLATIVRYRSRRSSSRCCEPGNRRHRILQPIGGTHHPDELSVCAKARRSFKVG